MSIYIYVCLAGIVCHPCAYYVKCPDSTVHIMMLNDSKHVGVNVAAPEDYLHIQLWQRQNMWSMKEALCSPAVALDQDVFRLEI